ncbi:MAG: hypothetical protein FJ387_27700 [Verrucomicrobia bacterium]|nr:hypothetical protein [Verrucomicrobiota bacterium]
MKTPLVSCHGITPSLAAAAAMAVLLVAGETPSQPATAREVAKSAGLGDKPLVEQALSRLASEVTRWDTLQRLDQLGSNEARQLILRVALGEFGWLHQQWACTLYLRSLQDKSEGRRLFCAQSDDNVASALRVMIGLPIGRQFMDDLGVLMKSRGFFVRCNSVRAIQEDPRGDFAEEKVKLLLESLSSAAALPDAHQPSRLMGWGDQGWSQIGDFSLAVAGALMSAKGIDLLLLTRLTPPDAGIDRDCMVIARRFRGDESVLAEYRHLMEHAELSGIRMTAISLLGERPQAEDREILERIAASDPHTFQPPPRSRHGAKDVRFPVREIADFALGRIDRLKQRQQGQSSTIDH